MRRIGVTAALLLALVPSALAAQEREQERPRDRAALEARVRETFAQVLRRELELTDAQAARLDSTLRRLEPRRRELLVSEGRVRRNLRRELAAGERADSRRVEALVDSLLLLQERRVALVREEQRELARFLSPVQRGRYLALQENLRRRMEARAAEGRGQRGGHPQRRPTGPPAARPPR